MEGGHLNPFVPSPEPESPNSASLGETTFMLLSLGSINFEELL